MHRFLDHHLAFGVLYALRKEPAKFHNTLLGRHVLVVHRTGNGSGMNPYLIRYLDHRKRLQAFQSRFKETRLPVEYLLRYGTYRIFPVLYRVV